MKEGAMPEPEPDDDTSSKTEETQSDKPDDSLGDGGKKALDAEREARKSAEKSLKDLQKQLKEHEDKDKTQDQRKDDRIKELESELAARDTALATKDIDLTRRDVAEKAGVPVSLVTGSTREEMEAAAKAAIEWRGPEKKKVVTGLRSGASKNDDTSTAKERAAAALRGLGSSR